MVHRLLAAVRRLGLDLPRFLGSWRLSIVLMTVLAFYQALLATWSTSTPPAVVSSIAGLVVFQLLYVLLLANTVVCFWRRLPRLREGAAVIGSFLFHGAFLLVALGFFTSFAARHEAVVWVAEGERYTGAPEQVRSQAPPRLLSWGLPELDFTVTSIVPEFWRDQLLFTRFEAELELPDGERATTRINSPLWWGPATWVRLSGFGYAPRWEVTNARGETVDSAFVKLDVFPPGQRDSFRVPRLPHRFYLEVLPDFAWDGDTPSTKSLNLANPAVVLDAWRGRVDLGRGVLERGQGYELEGLVIHFPEIRTWAQLSVVRDPGMPILFAGYLLGIAGLVLKLCRRVGGGDR